MPISHLKKKIFSKIINEWNERWVQSELGTTTREFIPTVDYRIKIKKHFTLEFETTQMITNHGKFNSYLHRFKIKDYSNCERCAVEPEDINHLIFNCETLQGERSIILSKCQESGIDWPCQKRELLSEQIFKHFKQFC
jgi:hypothetical protein